MRLSCYGKIDTHRIVLDRKGLNEEHYFLYFCSQRKNTGKENAKEEKKHVLYNYDIKRNTSEICSQKSTILEVRLLLGESA